MKTDRSISWFQRLQDHFFGAVDRFDVWSQPIVDRLSARLDSVQGWWAGRRRAH